MSEPGDELPEHVARNRANWDQVHAARFVEPGRRAWATDEISWGIFHVPEVELGVLPTELSGKDVIELGCGTAYISAWLARRGANVTGVDNSEEQLRTARELQQEHGLSFPLIHGNAESVPLPDAGFDLVVSEYGASIWADPYRWIPEATRLLRPGGDLVFLVNGTLWMLTVPDTDDEGPAAASVGRARAMRLALLSDLISAQEAYDAGLVTHVFDDDAYAEQLEKIVRRLSRGAPLAFAATKKAVNAATLGNLDGAFQRERAGQSLLLRTEDVAEGMRAFTEKRPPEFKGR